MSDLKVNTISGVGGGGFTGTVGDGGLVTTDLQQGLGKVMSETVVLAQKYFLIV